MYSLRVYANILAYFAVLTAAFLVAEIESDHVPLVVAVILALVFRIICFEVDRRYQIEFFDAKEYRRWWWLTIIAIILFSNNADKYTYLATFTAVWYAASALHIRLLGERQQIIRKVVA